MFMNRKITGMACGMGLVGNALIPTLALASEKMDNPLHHFEVHTLIPIQLFGLDLSVTNATVWMWVAIGLLYGFFMIVVKSGLKMVPGKMQSVAEVILDFLRAMSVDLIGKEGAKFFPFIATLFLFLLSCNLIGIIPGTYTLTSQIVVTGSFSICIFIMTLIVGFAKHGGHFFSILVPPGVPKVMIPFMIPLEFISMLVRPVTLSLRIFANMTAGHVLLGVLFGLGLSWPWYFGMFPIGATVIFNAFEVFVAVVQAYIFTLLTCVYISDVVNLH